MNIVFQWLALMGLLITLSHHKKYAEVKAALRKTYIHDEWDQENPIMVKDYGNTFEGQRLESKPEPLDIRESRINYNNVLSERNRLRRLVTNWTILTIVFLILGFV